MKPPTYERCEICGLFVRDRNVLAHAEKHSKEPTWEPQWSLKQTATLGLVKVATKQCYIYRSDKALYLRRYQAKNQHKGAIERRKAAIEAQRR